MSSGLLALLDDIAALVKVTSASLDDIATQAGAAGSKVAGVVIDDAAVTPKYVLGLSPKRELPIIWNITKGSLKNKLLFLMPAALLLGYFLPWAIKPILACGGIYLCFEGYEKLHGFVHKLMHKDKVEKAKEDAKTRPITPENLEKIRTNSAIRTDFILSAEIMAISYDTVSDSTLAVQIATLLFIAIGVTLGVYGFVGLIVKADDVGYHLAKKDNADWVKKLGRGIVKAMPSFLKFLATIGTAAMLWVGGGIIIHAVPFLHHELAHLSHALHLEGGIKWTFEAVLSGLFGILVGAVTEKLYKTVKPIYLKFKPS